MRQMCLCVALIEFVKDVAREGYGKQGENDATEKHGET